MVRKYTLYLDESGDFDRDLEASWKNECLIGGLLLREEGVSGGCRTVCGGAFCQGSPCHGA